MVWLLWLLFDFEFVFVSSSKFYLALLHTASFIITLMILSGIHLA